MAIEPRGCVASYHRGEQSLTLWTSTQIPHLVRTLLPGMIGVPENKMRIVAPEVGGGFGSKLNLYAEEALCAHLAHALDAPVKWIESPPREHVVHDPRPRSDRRLRSRGQERRHAARDQGTDHRRHRRLPAAADAGDSTLTGPMLTGCYKFKAMRMDVIGVYTNKMSTDAYRGAGRPEATYTIERMIDIVANELRPGSGEAAADEFPETAEFPFTTASGLTYDSGNYQGALKRRSRLDGWNDAARQRARRAEEGRLFGIGVSTYVEICALGPLEGDGGRRLGMGLRPHRILRQGDGDHRRDAARPGTGNQLRANRRRSARHPDRGHRGAPRRHDVAHYGRDTYGSRATVLGGTAIVMCIDKIIAKARRARGPHPGSEAPIVMFEDGRFSERGKPLGWADLAPKPPTRRRTSRLDLSPASKLVVLRAGELHLPVRHPHRRRRNRSRDRARSGS